MTDRFTKFFSFLSIISLIASPVFTYGQIVAEPASVEDFGEAKEVIVKYKNNDDIGIIEVPAETPIEEVITAIEENPAVEYAEPNFKRKVFALDINDTYAGLLWGHDNTGQLAGPAGSQVSGATDADMDIAEAWTLSTGETEVVVAVIDTGVLYTHPDLSGVMWTPSTCLNENGTTTTCVHGYDFVNNDSDPSPDHFHGSHVSGTIAATRGNSAGIAGVAPKAKIAGNDHQDHHGRNGHSQR